MISIDYEFNDINCEILNLVCCTTYKNEEPPIEWWLHKDPTSKKRLKEYLLKNKKEIFLGFACIAEARSFISLGLDPVQFQWIDLFIEWRHITNHNDRMMYGEHLVDGKKKYTKKPKPKWERTEQDSKTAFKLKHSLAEATFKLTGEIRDTEHKDRMRELIISSPEDFSPEERKDIMKYCTTDTVFLPKMCNAIIEEYKKLFGTEYRWETLLKEMLLRGEYSALTAIRESRGYPINYEATRNFANSVDSIIQDCQREINNLFPEIMPFRWVPKEGKYSWNQIATKDWLNKNVNTKNWMKTDSKDLSLALEAWQRVFDYKHNYPTDVFGAQIVRYLVLKQNLNGFKTRTEKGKKTFWDAVGPDQRVRPYMNIYGAQSSRSQPGSTAFLHLKPAWMRVLVEPPKGKAMATIDYGSEEFFLAALISRCPSMIEAYLSGDVYFYFAKKAGAVPEDAERKDYEAIRDLFKSTVLGISYLMTKYGLAIKLTADTGIHHDPDMAQEMIDKFYIAFPELDDNQVDTINNYYAGNYIKLKCGWCMWPDNENFRSAANMPIQGMGASILRKADRFCYDKGLYIPITLHDALTAEFDSDDLSAVDKLWNSMREAFVFYADDDQKDIAAKVKMDITIWSTDYEDGKVVYTPEGHKLTLQNKYIDKRAKRYYDEYKKYFNTPSGDIL